MRFWQNEVLRAKQSERRGLGERRFVALSGTVLLRYEEQRFVIE
jgi:hypothetical protein